MSVQLGQSFTRTEEAPSLDAFAGAIVAQVQRALESRFKEQDRKIAQALAAKTPVTVAPSSAQVRVDAPVTVHVPDSEPAEVSVEIPGMADMATQLRSIDGHLVELLAELRKPEVKEVQRDANGLITRVTEQR
jgi:hypothetical protein